MDHVPGTIYLLHLDRPYKHAQHYLGWASNLEARLAHHAAGTGANLLRVAKAAGINWTLARTWPGDRFRERQLKRQGGRARLCPICKEAKPAASKAKTQALRTANVAIQSQMAAGLTADNTELLAPELVANAAEHADGQAIGLALRPCTNADGPHGIVCDVSDSSPTISMAWFTVVAEDVCRAARQAQAEAGT